MDEEVKNKGFAGLSSLTSEIEDYVSTDDEAEKPNSDPSSSLQQGREPLSKSQRPDRPQKAQPDTKPGSSSGWKWLASIVTLIAVIALYNNQVKKTPPTSSTYEQPEGPYKQNTPPRTVETPIAPSVKIIEPKKEPKIVFEMPPVGRDHVLSVAQIRWCERENMRVDVKKPLIKSNEQVAEFNRDVDRYNQRCSSFRYRPGALERAKREVEKLQAEIQRAARVQFLPTKNEAPKSLSQQKNTSQKAEKPETQKSKLTSVDVRLVQKLLKELGYDPGPIDGLFGNRTNKAIKEFQKSIGASVTGQIDHDLIALLRRAREETTGSS